MSFCAASPEEWRDFDMEGGSKIAAKLPKLVTKRTAPIVTKNQKRSTIRRDLEVF